MKVLTRKMEKESGPQFQESTTVRETAGRIQSKKIASDPSASRSGSDSEPERIFIPDYFTEIEVQPDGTVLEKFSAIPRRKTGEGERESYHDTGKSLRETPGDQKLMAVPLDSTKSSPRRINDLTYHYWDGGEPYRCYCLRQFSKFEEFEEHTRIVRVLGNSEAQPYTVSGKPLPRDSKRYYPDKDLFEKAHSLALEAGSNRNVVAPSLDISKEVISWLRKGKLPEAPLNPFIFQTSVEWAEKLVMTAVNHDMVDELYDTTGFETIPGREILDQVILAAWRLHNRYVRRGFFIPGAMSPGMYCIATLAIRLSLQNHKKKHDLPQEAKVAQIEMLQYLDIQTVLVRLEERILGQHGDSTLVKTAQKVIDDSGAYDQLLEQQRLFIHPDSPRRAVFRAWKRMRKNSGLPAIERRLSYSVSWELPSLLRLYYPEMQKLGEIMVLTGASFNAQSSSCEEYLYATWPLIGRLLLQSLERTLSNSLDDPAMVEENKTIVRITWSKNEDSVEKKSIAHITLTADYESQLQMASALCWLCTAIRYSPSKKLSTSCAFAACNNDSIHITQGSLQGPQEALSVEACWHTLFPHGVIARGFPIRQRIKGRGLEIPISDMLRIGRCLSFVEYDGGLIGQGLGLLFIPVSEIPDDDALQWHFVKRGQRSLKEQLISNIFASEKIKSWYKTLDPRELTTRRCFLGWAESANVVIGTEEYFTNKVDWSGAQTVPPMLYVRSHGVAIGTGGLGFATATATLGLTPTSMPSSLTFPLNKDIYDILADGTDDYVLIYDNEEKRGWYLPQASVVLYIAHIVIERRHYRLLDGEEEVKLGFASPSPDGAAEALNILKASLDFRVKKGHRVADFADTIRTIWHEVDTVATGLESARGELAKTGNTAPKYLYGVEFLDVIQQERSMRVMQTKVKQHWAHLTKDQPVVLFCKSFGQAIVPTQQGGLCEVWREVPPRENYLATMGLAVSYLLKRHDAGREGTFLAEGLHWMHKGVLVCTHDNDGPSSRPIMHAQTLNSTKKPKRDKAIRQIMESYKESCFIFSDHKSRTCSSKVYGTSQAQRNGHDLMGRSLSSLNQNNGLLATHVQTTGTPSCPRCRNSTITEDFREYFLCQRHLIEDATPQQLDLSFSNTSLSNQDKADFDEERIEGRQDDESLNFENQTVQIPFKKGKTRETSIGLEGDPLTTPRRASLGENNEVDQSVLLPSTVRRRQAFSSLSLWNSSE